MRAFLALTLCGAMATPAAALAQAAPAPTDGQLAPNQPAFSDPVIAAPAATVVMPASAQAPPVEASLTPPPAPKEPAVVAPVLVEARAQPKSDMPRKVGVTVGGLLGGAAGTAGGPVGKFAGSFVGKRVAKTLLGRNKDDTPQLEVVQAQAFSAEEAGKSAVAEPATAPALIPASDPRPAQP